ncbi:MAG: biopolymer transporter ExbD [Bryobacterales bacterium]|nr:biopolymer transporter ExbD [Bryobacterales bacterium]
MGMTVPQAGSGVQCEMNVVPLIDVLLVLLIIFMVITPLTPKGLDALVPQPPPPGMQSQADNIRTVVIVLNRDGTMQINQDPIDEANLGARLSDIFKTRAERVVFVKGDPDLEYQRVARAIDIAKGAGLDKIGLMTAKVEAGQ